MVSGGAERWSYLEEGKTSDQLVDVLLEEIGTGVLKEKDTFPGLVWVFLFLGCFALVRGLDNTYLTVSRVTRLFSWLEY